jgi:hypothetical protein
VLGSWVAEESLLYFDDTIGLPDSHPAIEYRQTRTIRRFGWLDSWRVEAARAIDWLPAVVAHTIRAAYRFPEKTSFQPPKRSPRRPRGLYFHDEIGFGDVQGGEVFELTQSRSPTPALEKADKSEFVRRDAV